MARVYSGSFLFSLFFTSVEFGILSSFVSLFMSFTSKVVVTEEFLLAAVVAALIAVVTVVIADLIEEYLNFILTIDDP